MQAARDSFGWAFRSPFTPARPSYTPVSILTTVRCRDLADMVRRVVTHFASPGDPRRIIPEPPVGRSTFDPCRTSPGESTFTSDGSASGLVLAPQPRPWRSQAPAGVEDEMGEDRAAECMPGPARTMGVMACVS
jgi:hypothetical protein